jgi:hypothetical protein
VLIRINRQTIAAANAIPAIICKIVMANFLAHTDASWLKFFQNIYTVGLVITVLATILVNRYASRIAANTTLQVAEANKVAALANQRAEELEKENLEIKRQMADRFLTAEERKTFIDSVRGGGHAATVTFIQDREAAEYAQAIFSALKDAGWSVGKDYRQPYDPDPLPHGIICRISKTPDAMVRAVIDALGKIGANPRVENVQSGPYFIDIVVGTKSKD